MSISNYELLRNRRIIDILIGDTQFDIDGEVVHMPYLSGQMICDISTVLGFPTTYGWGGGALSRWSNMDNLMIDLIKEDLMDDLLKYLFDLQQFQGLINGNNPEEIEATQRKIVDGAISEINKILVFSKHELRVVNNKYVVLSNDELNVIETDTPKVMDIPYAKNLVERTRNDMLIGNYDSVITKSRTLIEEVLIYILEESGCQNEAKGNINKLLVEVKKLLNMQQNNEFDRRINSLLSGLEKIIQSIAEMRNLNSDAHGVGSRRIAIRRHEAELVINATITLTVYLLEVFENFKSRREVSK